MGGSSRHRQHVRIDVTSSAHTATNTSLNIGISDHTHDFVLDVFDISVHFDGTV